MGERGTVLVLNVEQQAEYRRLVNSYLEHSEKALRLIPGASKDPEALKQWIHEDRLAGEAAAAIKKLLSED
jgi:hypothetical protein